MGPGPGVAPPLDVEGGREARERCSETVALHKMEVPRTRSA